MYFLNLFWLLVYFVFDIYYLYVFVNITDLCNDAVQICCTKLSWKSNQFYIQQSRFLYFDFFYLFNMHKHVKACYFEYVVQCMFVSLLTVT